MQNWGICFVSRTTICRQSDMSCNSKWFTLLLLCTSALLVLGCDWFNHGSSQVKREPVDLVTEDYDLSLCQRIEFFCNWWIASKAEVTWHPSAHHKATRSVIEITIPSTGWSVTLSNFPWMCRLLTTISS